MAAGARRIDMDVIFTNGKLPSIRSESVPRSRSKTGTYSYAEKLFQGRIQREGPGVRTPPGILAKKWLSDSRLGQV